MLREWIASGWRLEGVKPALLEVEVVRRAQNRLVLDVTDRVVSLVAVKGETRRSMPADEASRHRVTFHRVRGGAQGSGDPEARVWVVGHTSGGV